MVQFFLAVDGGDSYPYTFNGFEKYFIGYLSFVQEQEILIKPLNTWKIIKDILFVMIILDITA